MPSNFQVDGKVFTIKVSTVKNKKYDVFFEGKKVVSFGDSRYQQYYDKIGHYRHLDHHDRKRRDAYYSRHGAANSYTSAKYWSHRILWSP